MNKLKGKIVVITGASSGIGRSTVLEFAKQEVKAIILVSRNKERLSQVESELSGNHLLPRHQPEGGWCWQGRQYWLPPRHGWRARH